MKKENGNLIYSPTDLIVFMESEFASWMNRYHLEFPGELTPDEADESLKILAAKGTDHEAAYLARLQEEGKDVCVIERGPDANLRTLEAMKAGREVIYQAALKRDNFAGFADFLVRVDGRSNLGDYHYEPHDTKLALKAKPYFLIQLCCYAEMLEDLQGILPGYIHIVLGNNEIKNFRTADYFYFYKQLKKAFLELQQSFNPADRPIPDGMADHDRWTSHADEILESMDHLCRVANMRSVQIKKLEKAGITTMAGLAATTLEHIPGMLSKTFATLKQQARLQVESRGLAKPKYELIPADPADPRRGFALLPPLSEYDVFFDMEGYPHVAGGLEYLFGVTYLERGQLQFKDWWAHNREEERQAFEQFIDWVHGRWEKHPAMHIYHYADYEVSAMRRLMGRYGTREREVDALLRNGVFVDLYTVVRQSMRVGEPKYSIKNMEHLYAGARAGAVAKASDSIVYYQRWLEHQDGSDWRTSQILAEIRAYNKEDCDSTWKLAEWLRQIRQPTGIAWIPDVAKAQGEGPQAQARDDAAQLAQELLSSLPEGDDQTERRALQELLAYLLEFHWREAKPVFWAMFDRHEMTEEQLVDDINCLGALEKATRWKEPIQKSFLYEYAYDPEQDTKIKVGDQCYFAHDLKVTCEIAELDTAAGRVAIKLGKDKQEPPDHLNLIPNERVRADVIARSIYQTVSRWKETGNLPRAIEDFLLRRRPRIIGNPAGPIICDPSDLTQGAIQAVVNLDNSTLCIQGPPGGGKTYTAARMILELLRLKKTVGVTSNSHKAIANLMDEVMREAGENGSIGFSAVKIQRESESFHVQEAGVAQRKSVKDVFGGGSANFQLIGGTAWAFSDDAAAGQLDYLFVDEAGQVSVANLVGMSRSTKNIVLIGDQMQLGQPIKGTHPGESGQSTLQYLLQDHQTIPENFGIFLGKTYRLHPHICEFISGAVYEDRLSAHSDTEKRVLVLPAGGGNIIQKTAGIIHISVEHEGNSQDSDEEARIVKELVTELLEQRVMNKDGTRDLPIELKNIAIVAPYNMQVRKIRDLIPGADVGSVDKFQGLQAPVVIVSMCSSTGDASPRGLDFILNKNRLNVAISRAQTLAIVVSSPALARTKCTNINDMELVNLFCRIVEHKPSH